MFNLKTKITPIKIKEGVDGRKSILEKTLILILHCFSIHHAEFEIERITTRAYINGRTDCP